MHKLSVCQIVVLILLMLAALLFFLPVLFYLLMKRNHPQIRGRQPWLLFLSSIGCFIRIFLQGLVLLLNVYSSPTNLRIRCVMDEINESAIEFLIIWPILFRCMYLHRIVMIVQQFFHSESERFDVDKVNSKKGLLVLFFIVLIFTIFMIIDVFLTWSYRVYFFGDLRYVCLKSKGIGAPFQDSYATISLLLLTLYTLMEALFLLFYCYKLKNIKKHFGVDQYFLATGICWVISRILLILLLAPQIFNSLLESFIYVFLVILLNFCIFFFQTFIPLWKVKKGHYKAIEKPQEYISLLDHFPEVLITKSAVYHFL